MQSELRKVERKLEKVRDTNSEKNEYYLDIQIPVQAFITFESESGYDTAIELGMKRDGDGNIKDIPIPKILDSRVVFKQAPEPTNIIWENMHIPKKV